MKHLQQKTYMPYRTLIDNNPRAYEVMLLHDQERLTYAQIGRKISLSTGRVTTLYYEAKSNQIRLYSACIAHETGTAKVDIDNECYKAFQCYYDSVYVAAHLEKVYTDILNEYRAGEPGMPRGFIDKLPPYREKFGGRTVARIIEMREKERKTYIAIGSRLRITPQQVKRLYMHYYFKKNLKIFERVEKATGRHIRSDYLYRVSQNAKTIYDTLLQDYPDFVK